MNIIQKDIENNTRGCSKHQLLIKRKRIKRKDKRTLKASSHQSKPINGLAIKKWFTGAHMDL